MIIRRLRERLKRTNVREKLIINARYSGELLTITKYSVKINGKVDLCSQWQQILFVPVHSREQRNSGFPLFPEIRVSDGEQHVSVWNK